MSESQPAPATSVKDVLMAVPPNREGLIFHEKEGAEVLVELDRFTVSSPGMTAECATSAPPESQGLQRGGVMVLNGVGHAESLMGGAVEAYSSVARAFGYPDYFDADALDPFLNKENALGWQISDTTLTNISVGPVERQMSVESYAQAAAEVADRVGHHDIWVGRSIGGAAAQRLFLDRLLEGADTPNVLLLVDSGPGFTEGNIKYLKATGQIEQGPDGRYRSKSAPEVASQLPIDSAFTQKLIADYNTAWERGLLKDKVIVFMQAHSGEGGVAGPIAHAKVDDIGLPGRVARDLGFTHGGMFGDSAAGDFPGLNPDLAGHFVSYRMEGHDHMSIMGDPSVNLLVSGLSDMVGDFDGNWGEEEVVAVKKALYGLPPDAEIEHNALNPLVVDNQKRNSSLGLRLAMYAALALTAYNERRLNGGKTGKVVLGGAD